MTDYSSLSLSALLDRLPEQNPQTGWYYELRKQSYTLQEEVYSSSFGVLWVCSRTNFKNNMDGVNRTGYTPEEAIIKMLKYINGEE